MQLFFFFLKIPPERLSTLLERPLSRTIDQHLGCQEPGRRLLDSSKVSLKPDGLTHPSGDLKDFQDLKQATCNKTTFPRCPTKACLTSSHSLLLWCLLWKENDLVHISQSLVKGGETLTWIMAFWNQHHLDPVHFLEGLEGSEFTKAFPSSELWTEFGFLSIFMVSEFATWEAVLLLTHLFSTVLLTWQYCFRTSLKFCCFAKISSSVASCL